MRIALSVGLAAVLLWGGVEGGGGPPAPSGKQPPPRMDLRKKEGFRNRLVGYAMPPMMESRAGVLDATLDVRYAENRVGRDRVWTRTYNGLLVGPTIRVRPGDTLKIKLKNRLPENPPKKDADHNRPHDFNSTNLHTHGLHVSPKDKSDNVFIDVAPGKDQAYCFTIPKGHPCGTFWYHAHRHGAVAVQLSSGMAGALIVEGEGIDTIPEILDARESILVFQQILYRYPASPQEVGQVDEETVYNESPDPEKVNLDTTINGIKAPTLYLQPGEVQRWRLIHAGLGETLKLSLVHDDDKEPKLDLHQVAVDGLPLRQIQKLKSVELQPGYRSDLMVQAPDSPGVLFLISGEVPAARSIRKVNQPKKYLAKIVVQGPPRKMPLPAADSVGKFAPKSISDEEIGDRKREIRFNIEDGSYTVNGKSFDPDKVDLCPRVGTAEEWKVGAEVDRHPFHIHVNPFEVIERDEKGKVVNRVWRDTLLVTESDAGPLTIRIRFKTFSGKTVLHCHNLRHEDKGMMKMIKILEPNEADDCDKPAKTGFRNLPEKAPEWVLPGPDKTLHRLTDFQGTPVVLVFSRGLGCAHCARQLDALAERQESFKRAGFVVVAVSPDAVENVGAALGTHSGRPRLPFLLLSDPKREAFRRYGCGGERPLHGTFLIDAGGMVRWQSVGEEPFMGVSALLRECEKLGPRPGS